MYIGAVKINRAKVALIPIELAGGQPEALSKNLVGRLCKLAMLDYPAKKANKPLIGKKGRISCLREELRKF